jgi:hypothetical protein
VRLLLIVAAACLFLPGCPAEEPIPSPTPTPSPSTEPPIVPPLQFPLRVDGSQFVNADGSPAWLMGPTGCCWDPVASGWPLASDAFLEEAAAHHGNVVHIRLGPFNASLYEGPQFQPSPAFFDRVRHVLAKALELGIAVVVVPIDAWAMKRSSSKNFFNWGCNTTQAFPTHEQLDWVERVISHTAGYPNVLYGDNESFECGVRPIWAVAILDALKTGAPEHLVGTNSQRADIERHYDFVQRHGCEDLAGPVEGKPTLLDEFNNCDPGEIGRAAWWEDSARRAHRNGYERLLWRDGLNDAAWADALARLKRWREGGA